METLLPATSSTVSVEQPCIRCGYSLIRLPITGTCPECGTSVEHSLRGDMLAYSDPDYVRTLAKGSGLVILSIPLTVVVGILAAVIASQLSGGMFFAQLLTLSVVAVFLFGWWKLTTPDLGQHNTNTGEKPRRIVRLTGVLFASISLITIILDQALSFDFTLMQLLSGIRAVIFGTCLWAGMGYLRWLTPRIPHHNLYTRAGTLRVLLVVAIAVELISSVVNYFMVQRVMMAMAATTTTAPATPAAPPATNVFSSPWFWISSALLAASVLFSLVVLIIYIIQMWSLRTQLRRTLREADLQAVASTYANQ